MYPSKKYEVSGTKFTRKNMTAKKFEKLKLHRISKLNSSKYGAQQILG